MLREGHLCLHFEVTFRQGMAIVVSSLLEKGPMVHFKMVSAVKLTTSEFPEPIGAGSLNFSEQYLLGLFRNQYFDFDEFFFVFFI